MKTTLHFVRVLLPTLLFTTLCCVTGKGFSQTFNVGEGGDYETLNDAVTAYNGMVLTQPVIFLLTDNFYESGDAIVINKNATASAARTLTIRPAPGVECTLQGTVATALLQIVGDNVIVDGSNNGSTSRNLTIDNLEELATAKVLQLGGAAQQQPATNITVKNTVIVNGFKNGNGFQVSGFFRDILIENNQVTNIKTGIYIEASTGPFQNGTNVTIRSNDLSVGGLSAIQNTGIYVSGVSGGCTIANNTIGNFDNARSEIDRGIWVAVACSTVVISNNTISNLDYSGSGSNQAPIGIDVSAPGGTGITVMGNAVFDISAITGTGSPKGIALGSSTTGVSISNNQISDIKSEAFNSTPVYGIHLAPTSTFANVRCFNNFISDISSAKTGRAAYGIGVASGKGILVANNTVYITTANTTGPSAAFFVSTGVTATGSIDLQNNVFVNRLGAASTSNYAILQENSTAVFSVINNNDYEGSPMGNRGANILATLADLKSAFGTNTNSLDIAPVFESATNLHMATVGNNALDNKGIAMAGITTDIDGTPRSAATPDMGAHEFGNITGAALVISCSVPNAVYCPGGSISVSYTVVGTATAGNVFTAQLSNGIGGFGAPIAIGTLAATGSGIINATMPANAGASTAYRIRVVSSLPAYTGTDNGSGITIQKPFPGTITGTETAIAGTAYPYSVVLHEGSIYAWTFLNGTQNTGGNTNSVTGTYNVAGNQQVTVTETDPLGCTGITTKLVTVTAAQTDTYTFNGTGNWDNAANWLNSVVPPANVPALAEVIISPATAGECILNIPVVFAATAKLTIKPGAVFKAKSNLTLE